jgi:hypothetical protein
MFGKNSTAFFLKQGMTGRRYMGRVDGNIKGGTE